MTVEEPKQLGEIVIEIAGEKLQVAECENGMLLCSENGAGMKKVDCDIFKQELKKKLMRTAEKSSVQTRTAAVSVKRVHKFLKRQERLGEVRKNNAGETMEIVQYNNANDMTVRFEDGTEKTGVSYFNFERGNVRKDKSIAQKKEERLGEVRRNTAGETMKIVQYDNSKNMIVRFEDGTERKGVAYSDFKKGQISKFGIGNKKKGGRLGEVRRNTAGETMKIVQYDSNKNMTVRFEDGTERKGVAYSDFKKGQISKLGIGNKKKGERLGEVQNNTAGETMKIVQYYNNKNVTVRFEDGTERKGVVYARFKKGHVSKPGMKHRKKEGRLGEIRKNNAGETMEIVQYDNANNMMVRFEDGTERKGVRYANFKIGRVSKPGMEHRKKGGRLGEVRKNNAGETMQIVRYVNCTNITVRFEDGTEREGVQYSNFKTGQVSKLGMKHRKSEKRLGEVRKNNAGETMQIVQYVNSNNVTVRFEDGTERKRVEYATFKKGTIRKVKSRGRDVKREERLGETNTNSAGETMKIVGYNSCKDITVRFEDGTEREGVQYTQFKKGNLRKPKRGALSATNNRRCYYGN